MLELIYMIALILCWMGNWVIGLTLTVSFLAGLGGCTIMMEDSSISGILVFILFGTITVLSFLATLFVAFLVLTCSDDS